MNINNQMRSNIQWLIQGISWDLLKEILDSIDSGKNCEVIRSDYRKKLLKYTHNQESFYIKQYTIKHGINAFKSLFSVSKAQKEWNQSHLLLKNHLLTAVPVAAGERRRFGILKDCYIISRAIPASISIKEFLAGIQQSSSNYGQLKRNTLLTNLISYIRKIHDCGIFHGELHAENILVDQNNTSVFYLIDLGRTKLRRNLPLSWRIKDLSRLFYAIRNICTHEEIIGLINTYASQTSVFQKQGIFS